MIVKQPAFINSDPPLRDIVARIVQAIAPEKVVLFGSLARGEAGPGSDLDFLIIKDSLEPRYERAVPVYYALRDIMIPMDIIVYTPAEITEWSRVRQAFVTTALREGRVLYEKKTGFSAILDSEGGKRS